MSKTSFSGIPGKNFIAFPAIIDVREWPEFKEFHLPGAKNFPLSEFSLNDFLPFRHQEIILLCENGSRAREVREKLIAANFSRVKLAETQMERFLGNTQPAPIHARVERQFRSLAYVILSKVFNRFSVEQGPL